MRVLVNGNEVELLKKEKKVGSEAPAGRVKKRDGSESVIGMIAPTMQLLITIPTLNNPNIIQELKDMNEYLTKMKKLKAYIITTSNENLDLVSDLTNLEFVFDDSATLISSFGVKLAESEYKSANALFVVDKEGVIKYIEITKDIFDKLSSENLASAIDKILADRKKGHVHENWMRA